MKQLVTFWLVAGLLAACQDAASPSSSTAMTPGMTFVAAAQQLSARVNDGGLSDSGGGSAPPSTPTATPTPYIPTPTPTPYIPTPTPTPYIPTPTPTPAGLNSIQIMSPSVGTTVSDTITIQISVSMAAGVDHVEFYLDRWATDHLMGSIFVAPYSLVWDTTRVPSGKHTLGARAYDKQGNFVQQAHDVYVTNGMQPTPTPTPVQ